MSDYRAAAERLVAAANPRFKDFRVDFERISTAACKAARGGGRVDEARAMFNDLDWDIRLPLQRRYAEVGAFDAIAHYHAKRFKLLLGRNSPWPDEPGQAALDLFVAYGRAEVGVALVRAYIDMQHKRLKKDYSKRNPRQPRKDLDEISRKVMGAIGKAIAEAIPDRKRELLCDLESVTPYVTEHGTDEDRAWLVSVNREIWRERRA